MSKIKRLEEDLRANPDNPALRVLLVAELTEGLGYSLEEAEVHARYISIMSKRAKLLAQAGELMNGTSPFRDGLIRAALTYVNLFGISGAAFHVVTGGDAPEVEDKPRTVGGREQTVVVRLPAAWVIATARELVRPAPRPRRRPGGDN